MEKFPGTLADSAPDAQPFSQDIMPGNGQAPADDWHDTWNYTYEDECKSAVRTQDTTGAKSYTRNFDIPENAPLDDLAIGIWQFDGGERHIHTIANLTVEAYIHIHDVNWTAPQSPRGQHEINAGSITLETHKKNDSSMGEQLILYQINNPDDPRSKHKRKQICIVNVHTASELIPAPAEADTENKTAYELYFKRSKALNIIKEVAKQYAEGKVAVEKLRDLEDATVASLGGNVKEPEKSTRKRKQDSNSGASKKKLKKRNMAFRLQKCRRKIMRLRQPSLREVL